MNHLTDEQLILHFYGEAKGSAQLEAHLAECGECKVQYQTLQRLMNTLDGTPIPERPPDYGRQVWNRIAPHLGGRPAKARPAWLAWLNNPRQWAVASAVAGLVVMAFLVGRFAQNESNRQELASQQQSRPGEVRERILLVALGEHLEQSQMMLVELSNAPPSRKIDLSEEQQRAEDLIAANRLYRQAALKADEPGVASVLEDLERTLMEIAHAPSSASAQELEDLRSRMAEQGILFKIRVMETQVRQRQQAGMQQQTIGW